MRKKERKKLVHGQDNITERTIHRRSKFDHSKARAGGGQGRAGERKREGKREREREKMPFPKRKASRADDRKPAHEREGRSDLSSRAPLPATLSLSLSPPFRNCPSPPLRTRLVFVTGSHPNTDAIPPPPTPPQKNLSLFRDRPKP